MEFKIAIIFVVTVGDIYTNEFFKTKLTTNSGFVFVLFCFVFLHLQYVYSLSQLFRNLQNSRGDKEPILLPDGLVCMSNM